MMNPTPRIGLFVRPSVRKKSRIMDTCITHQGQGSLIYASFISASYTHTSGSRIIHIYIVDTCIMQIFIGIKDHRYVHHTYMHQGQRSRIIDSCDIHMCIIHTCIMINFHSNVHHEYMHHEFMHHGYKHHDTCITDTCIMDT